MATAVAGTALGACGDGQIGAGIAGFDLGGLTIRVVDFPGLTTIGQPVAVGNARAVVRTGALAFIGLSMICTHQQCGPPDVHIQATQFLCNCHGSRFTADGSVVNGPAVTPLLRLAVTDNGDGTISVL